MTNMTRTGINWKKILIAVSIGAVMLYIIFSFAPHGLAKEAVTAEQYQFMIDYVQKNGIDGDAAGEPYKYLVYDISPVKNSRRVIRIVEFSYSYPPWEGVNITTTTHVNYDDGSRLVVSFHMDDATMDRMPDSVISIAMRWDAKGNIVREEARSLSTLTPIWTKYLEYVYEQMIEGVDA